MTITKQQLEKRRDFLGSSDVAALFGLDPFKNQRDVWAEKTQPLNGKPKESEAMAIGNMLEDALIDWTRNVVSLRQPPTDSGSQYQRIKRNVERRNGILLCHLDAAFLDLASHVEAKTTGHTDGWLDTTLEEPTAGVPAHVLIQCHVQMICADTVGVWIPVIMPGFNSLERRMYYVTKDEEMAAMIQGRCDWWWRQHVRDEKEPEDEAPPDRKLLNRIIRQPGTWKEVLPVLLHECGVAAQQAATANHMKEKADNNLIAAMRDADGARAAGMDQEYTLFEQSGKTTYGTKDKYLAKCSKCGIGSKKGDPYRVLRHRKRTDS